MKINKKDKTITIHLNDNEISNWEFHKRDFDLWEVYLNVKLSGVKKEELKELRYLNAFEEIETSKRNIKYNEKEIKKCSKNIEKYERIIKEVENEI